MKYNLIIKHINETVGLDYAISYIDDLLISGQDKSMLIKMLQI